ncbi:tryptophan 7-halogenase [Hyphobacterium sp. CCMP332]|uniref:tryptophan 7-halogenase n=1 Tax=Hyphobacterium sp. CCMP332 TaxID=2749086 RepID=UPI00164FB6F5|nr:tryptophan 7-halogenase [Hyphobacterium sp. CCMP332]QNL19668.1 tryptophan 7-halogenase [Hyphobacterium sp. CCMP332]
MRSLTKNIAVCGGGLAGNMVATRLVAGLGADWKIFQLCDSMPPQHDIAYGNTSDPDSYNFLLDLGLNEPTLFLKSATSFSFGTHFSNWLNRSWMQCHHTPFQTLRGIPFRHFVARSNTSLEPLLISARAAIAGRFAHPPKDPAIILSRAEYGYQFDVREWAALLEQKVLASRVIRKSSPIRSVTTDGDTLTGLKLENGEDLEVDLVIDAAGTGRDVIGAAGGRFRSHRTVRINGSITREAETGPPLRDVCSQLNGWTSTAHLQKARSVIQVEAADSGGEQAGDCIDIGLLDRAWVGNCIAIGHAASVIEPLTPAPVMMLRRDIDRLLELIPVSSDMTIERREFNRRFHEDYEHIGLFHSALMDCDDRPDTPYWQAAASGNSDDKLRRKIDQFENRGKLASYDLEPFNDEDWTILHLGMGRRPRIYDRQVDRVPRAESESALTEVRQSIQQLVSKMPPHGAYIDRLKQFLSRQDNV